MCWDDMGLPVLTKLAILTNNSKYVNVVTENLNYWMTTLEKTPGGLAYLHYWGALRYAAAESMIAFIYYGHTKNKAYYDFATSQVNYILGNNPAGLSYLLGYGNWKCEHVHHRAANGHQGYNDNNNALPALNELTGAMVGGPDNHDKFSDSVYEYQYTEVAIDYNAGIVGALAGMLRGDASVTPTPTPTPTSTPAPGLLGDVNNSGKVDIIDALSIAQYSAGIIPAIFNTALADFNNDGKINILDALLVARYSAGL
jgi:hypothetical protein